MDDKLRNEMRDYAWKYFALHADQRIKTFNFFLVLCALAVGGVITLLKDAHESHAGVAAAMALSFISLIFWKLDIRNRHLVRHAEEALKLLESDDRLPDDASAPHRLKLFQHEECMADDRKQGKWLRCIPKYWTYSTCFNAVFLVFGLAGMILAVVSLICGSAAPTAIPPRP